MVEQPFVYAESRYVKNNRCTVCAKYMSKDDYGIYCPCCGSSTRKSARYSKNKEWREITRY